MEPREEARDPVDRSIPLLIVDDDPKIREVVRFALDREGFTTLEAGNGAEALDLFRQERPGVVILDIVMPEMDGTEVCRALRAESRVPIIFLSSRDDEVDRILGLELGGDDYVTKPFSPRELVARVRAVLRRVDAGTSRESPGPGSRELRHGKLTLDLDRFQVRWGDREVVLTVTEFGLLRSLLEYPGKVYTRDELMDRAYAYDNVVSGRTIDSHIRRVRKKLSAAGGDPIETVHGLGYKIGSCE
jgi:two-component system OmpR family response regulator